MCFQDSDVKDDDEEVINDYNDNDLQRIFFR